MGEIYPYLMPLKSKTIDELTKGAIDEVQTMKKAGASSEDILLFLVRIANQLSGPESTASILVLDEKGLLRNGSSPDLPLDYIKAIDGIKPDPNVGTCAAAAATGNIVITTSFLADDKWAELRQLPMGIGYKSAWSVPIKSHDNKVLGTFGTYFRHCRQPTPNEMTGIQLLATAAALALLQK